MEIVKAVFDCAPDAILIMDNGGRIIRANAQTEKLFGYRREEILGLPVELLVPERFGATHKEQRAGQPSAAGAGPMGTVLESFGRRKDGTQFPLEIMVNTQETNDGSFVLDVVRDITQRKQIEEQARESAEMFFRLFEFAPDAVLVINEGGSIERANAKTEQIFGYPRAELIGRPIEILVPERLAARHREFRTNYIREPRTRPMGAGLELFGLRKGGVEFPVDIMLSPVQGREGRVVLAVVRDITERRLAERSLAANETLLRQFLKHAPAAIAILDTDMRYLQCSDRWLADYGLDGRDIIGSSHYEVFSDVPERWKVVHRRVLAGAIERCDEDRFHREDGSVVWIQWECQPWRNAAEEIGGLIMFSQTVTGRKLADEQVRASLREKEVLLKEIHHRVKNNLQIISSLLYLQSTYVKDDTALDILAESQSRVKAIALIHEKLYRSEQFDKIDFASYLHDLIAKLFHTYRVGDDSVTIHTDIEGVRLEIETALPCGLIVNELVSNALKHAFPHCWTGEVWVELHQDSDNRFVLTVRDDGIGLPANLDWHRSQSLGLQLVSDLTKQLRGELEVCRDAGTCVRLRFAELHYKERG
jgi:PAS domain S-box-containing protein